MYGRISRYTKIFGEWEIEEVLWEGKEVTVYKVSKSVVGLRDVAAVKAITICKCDGKKEELSESFLKGYEEKRKEREEEVKAEVELMQKLRGNTNIVGYLDAEPKPWTEINSFGVDLLLRMELLRDLARDLKEDKNFSEQEIIRIGKDICNALRLCHSKRIVHRDIKPENIFQNDDGNYKLGDFGISRIIDIAQESNMTVGLGTYPYMAPEQYEQDDYDLRVDIYSLGLVLYELANSNRPPFSNRIHDIDPPRILERLMGKKFPAPAQASEPLASVIMKACAHSPEERYQSAEEFWDALNGLEKRGADMRKHTANASYGAQENFAKDAESTQKQKEVDLYATSPADVEKQNRVDADIYATRPADAQEQYGYQETVSDIPQEVQMDAHIQELIERAQQGDMISQYNLAWCYDLGDGIEKNPEEAARWYRKAAEQGYALAQINIGKCYMNAYGVVSDAEEAVKWYMRAACQGYAEAQNLLGVCYDGGNGVAQSYAEAVKWFQEAAEQGYAYAQSNLGVYYGDGKGVLADAMEAVKWYRRAAEQGYADAQNRLGVCYADGTGVTQSYDEAVKWYRKAAEQGNMHAQYNLGLCYADGQGVSADAEEAVKWYRRAAEQGYAEAQNLLGVCYGNGTGVTQSYDEAIKWYRKAAEQGDMHAQYNLGVYYANGLGVSADIEEAVKWYRRAAEQGNADAQNGLGVCYHDGVGVEVNEQEAIKWYRRSAEQGFHWAYRNMGKCYETGFGVEQDMQEAIRWYRKAAELGNEDAAEQLRQIQ